MSSAASPTMVRFQERRRFRQNKLSWPFIFVAGFGCLGMVLNLVVEPLSAALFIVFVPILWALLVARLDVRIDDEAIHIGGTFVRARKIPLAAIRGAQHIPRLSRSHIAFGLNPRRLFAPVYGAWEKHLVRLDIEGARDPTLVGTARPHEFLAALGRAA